MSISDYKEWCPDAVAYFQSSSGKKEFSALTLVHGCERLIIYNDSNSPKRSNADVMHELAHIILNHPAKPPINQEGDRHYDGELEEEANWLGPALLVSDEGALFAARSGWSLKQSSDYFGVSEELMRMRLNVSGAHKRISRAA